MSIFLPTRRFLGGASWAKNTLWARARAIPSLDLRFAESKSLVDATTGQNLVSFTRASSGTYVDSQGVIRTATTNEPRFDHNPTTGESLGLLVEEQRTNVLIDSAAFTNWNGLNITVAENTTTAPSGLSDADMLTGSGSLVTQSKQRTFSGIAGEIITISFYAKYVSHAWVQTFLDVDTTVWANFNIQAGTVGSTGANATAMIVNAGNGWYRCICTKTASNASSPTGVRISLVDSSSAARNAASSTTGSVYLWGAQLEAGAFPTSYIPTTTATVTRSADVASISGSNFSSWYRQDEGTVFTQTQGATVASALYSIDDTTTSQRIIGQYASAIDLQYRVVNSGADQFNASHSAISSGQQVSHVQGYKANDFAGTTNGLSPLTDTSGTVPAVTRIVIGANVAAANYINKPIRRLTYWPQRLSNSTLQSITQ